MNSRTQNAKRNIIWGLFAKITTIILPFATRTILIRTLGMNYVGLGSLFTSLLGLLSFAELGVGGAIVFSMYKPVAEGNDAEARALLKFFRKCYRLIALVILAVGLSFELLLPILIKSDVPDDINIHVLFLIYLLNTVTGYLTTAYKSSVFSATQRVDITNKVKMLINFVSNVVQILLLLVFRNYYVYILVMPVATLLDNVVVAVLSHRYFPQYYCDGELPREKLREIGKNVGGMVFQKIGNIILGSVDTVVISAFLGLSILGIYNGYYMVVTGVASFVGLIQAALVSSVGNSIATESIEKNYADMRMFLFLHSWIMVWCAACILCLIQPFITLWQGKENQLPFGMATIFVIYFFVHHIGDMSAMYKEAAGLWWQGKMVPFVSSIVNLTLNLILVQKIGLYGILASTIIAIAFVNIPFGSLVLFRHYFKSLKGWYCYLLDIVWALGSAVVVCGGTYWLCGLLPDMPPLKQLLLRGVLCVFLPNIMMLFLQCRNANFKRALSFLKKAVGR